MPETDLISQYLIELRRQVRQRPDADDVVLEVEDHLREAAAGLVAAGCSEADAQRLALARFGDRNLMKDALAATPSTGLVMPSVFTRIAGASTLMAAALWAGTAVLVWWSSGLFAPWSEERYMTMTLVAVAALALTGVALAGLLCRIGRPTATALAAVLFALGAVGIAIAPWSWLASGLFIGGAFLGAVVQCREVLGAAAWPLWATAFAWPVGLATFVLVNGAGLGPVNEYGEHPAANAVAFSATAGVLVVGLGSLGAWLAFERAGARGQLAIA